MIEQKIKANFLKPEPAIVKLGNQEIQVETFLRHADQQILIAIYLKELFAEENGNHNDSVSNAENALILSIIEMSTNLMTFEGEGESRKPAFNLNDLYANWDFVKEVLVYIQNYKEFRNRLSATVEFINEQRRLESSIGAKVEMIIAKITNFIDDLSNTTPEKLETMKSLLKEAQSSEVIKDAVSIFKSRTAGESN